ncbi:MAG: AzlD domain-containing protein [Lachnospiraceae bacterium]|nr:AzlD domain-containing protein [Lachnospiraceae bacterium]
MNNTHAALMVLVIGLVTVGIRFLPFLIFGGKRKTPELITYLGTVLPYAIMGMLVVYCLRNTSFSGSSHGIPEIVSCILVVALHLWKRNTLISIVGGTVCYMFLVQAIF